MARSGLDIAVLGPGWRWRFIARLVARSQNSVTLLANEGTCQWINMDRAHFEAAGRELELDAIGGAVIRRGTRVGVATPVTTRLVDELRARAKGRAE